MWPNLIKQDALVNTTLQPKTLLPGLNSWEVAGLARKRRQKLKKVAADILFLRLLVILIRSVKVRYSFTLSLFHYFILQGGELSETQGKSVCPHLSFEIQAKRQLASFLLLNMVIFATLTLPRIRVSL